MSFASHIKRFAEAEILSHRHLPNAPDGTYEPAQEDPGVFLNTVNRIHRSVERGLPLPQNPHAVKAFLQAIDGSLTHSGIDDRLHAFEDGIGILSSLDPDSAFVAALNRSAITGLYNNLPHPPASFVGNSKFRHPDGGFNNLYWPDIGRAGQPYARNAQAHTPIPDSDLPDPGLVFDALLQRRDKPDENPNHPNGNSAFTFAFASLVTHTLFRTNHCNISINDTSSYLDLSPLYGSSRHDQDAVRHKDGRGRLYPDTFSEDRLAHLPPACSALLVIFNRNHNYTADMLFKINEKGQWKDPSLYKKDDPRLYRQDDEIFQTARLINCGHFMSMVLNDYLAGFLGNAANGHSWHMKPFNKIHRLDGTEVGRGEGNNVSVEFNLLYRWHATISEADGQWTSKMMSHIFGGRTDWENITVNDFMKVAHDPNSPLFPTDEPRVRDIFPGLGLSRGKDGSYKDEDIARIIQNATSEPAHRYGARAIPSSLRIIEVMTIMRGRQWGVCTMNEFRQCMGLKKFESFEDWNSDPDIANAARQLYQHIDRLELYAGLQAEETMELRPGSGFCIGYTTMRAILSDAICLIRGDRFFTTDFTPGNLTAWGFGDVEPVQDNGAFAACLPKLLLRHLPDNYTYNSVYGLFPFFTPESMEKSLTKQGVIAKYDFSTPKTLQPVAVLETLQSIRTVFDDFERFKVTYTDDMKFLTDDYGFFLVFDERTRHDADKHLALTALWGQTSLSEFVDFYKTTTQELIEEHSFSYDVLPSSPSRGRYVDIVRNVINITSVRWAADYLTGMSLKTKDNPDGEFTEVQAYQMLMVLFMCVFENVDPEHGWFLRTTAKKIADELNAIIENSLEQVRPRHPISAFFARATMAITSGSDDLVINRPCYSFLSRLAESGRPLKDLVATVIGLAVGSSVNYAQVSAQIVDFYLDDARAKERADIVRLVATSENDEDANQRLIGYIKEAQRLAPQFPGLLRISESKETVRVSQGSGKKDVVINPGQLVYGSYYFAQTNPIDFPDPFTVDPTRPRDKYAVQGIGFHGCPGVRFAERTLLAVMRVIFSLKNVRRAPGVQGRLASFQSQQNGTPARLYLDDKGAMTPWPGQLLVVYDE